MPAEISGEDLDEECQWYLFDNIRQFCRSRVRYGKAMDQDMSLPKCLSENMLQKKKMVTVPVDSYFLHVLLNGKK